MDLTFPTYPSECGSPDALRQEVPPGSTGWLVFLFSLLRDLRHDQEHEVHRDLSWEERKWLPGPLHSSGALWHLSKDLMS